MQIFSPVWSIREKMWTKVRDTFGLNAPYTSIKTTFRHSQTIPRKTIFPWITVFHLFKAPAQLRPGISFHLKLYVICSVLYVQFNFLLHFYLFMFHHFIYADQRAKNLLLDGSPFQHDERWTCVEFVLRGLRMSQSASGTQRCCRWNRRESICDRAVCLSHWGGPVALWASCNPSPPRSRSTEGPSCRRCPGATHLISHKLSPQIIRGPSERKTQPLSF